MCVHVCVGGWGWDNTSVTSTLALYISVQDKLMFIKDCGGWVGGRGNLLKCLQLIFELSLNSLCKHIQNNLILNRCTCSH